MEKKYDGLLDLNKGYYIHLHLLDSTISTALQEEYIIEKIWDKLPNINKITILLETKSLYTYFFGEYVFIYLIN